MGPVPGRPLHPRAQDVGDKLFSRKRVRQPGPQEAFVFSASGSCLTAGCQSGGFSVLLPLHGCLVFAQSRPGSSAGPRRRSWDRSTSQQVAVLCPGDIRQRLQPHLPVTLGGGRSRGLVMSPEMPLSTRGWTQQPRSAEDDQVHKGRRAMVEKQQLGDGPLRLLSLREGRAVKPGLRETGLFLETWDCVLC